MNTKLNLIDLMPKTATASGSISRPSWKAMLAKVEELSDEHDGESAKGAELICAKLGLKNNPRLTAGMFDDGDGAGYAIYFGKKGIIFGPSRDLGELKGKGKFTVATFKDKNVEFSEASIKQVGVYGTLDEMHAALRAAISDLTGVRQPAA